MTLQKHNSLYVYALLSAAILYTAPVNNLHSTNISYYYRQVSQDTILPYQHGILTSDSIHKLFIIEMPSKPQVNMNSAAVKFVQQFLKKNKKYLLEIELRSKATFNMIESILAKNDLPLQLKYLAVVESDLKADAKSHAGAVGLWQLMQGTAKELGLKVAGKVDERRHVKKSSIAAAKYLKTLYKEYGDWLLVIAAYNSGPGVVNKAIKKSGSRNFWKLQHHLPAETRGHVKRYIAIHYFFENAGSETTLTKAENAAYAKELQQYNFVIEELSKPIDTTLIRTASITN